MPGRQQMPSRTIFDDLCNQYAERIPVGMFREVFMVSSRVQKQTSLPVSKKCTKSLHHFPTISYRTYPVGELLQHRLQCFSTMLISRYYRKCREYQGEVTVELYKLLELLELLIVRCQQPAKRWRKQTLQPLWRMEASRRRPSTWRLSFRNLCGISAQRNMHAWSKRSFGRSI